MAETNDLRSLEQRWQRSSDEIRQDIAAKRESISETVDRLGDHLQRKLDWRDQVGQHPYMALGAAAAVGVLISGIFKHRPTPRERIMDAMAETIEDFTDDVRHSVSSLFLRVAGPSFLRSAIAGVLTKTVVQAFKSKSGSDTRWEQ
jgi:ElaB/YqjD/DUF883 family membrane-anchored ribosome-binding protein